MRPRSCPHWHLKGFERECASNETVVDEVNERGMPQGEQCSAAQRSLHSPRLACV